MWKYRRASCLWNDGQTSNSRCSILSVEWCNPAAGVNIGGALHSWPLLPQSAAPAGSSHLTTARIEAVENESPKIGGVRIGKKLYLLPRTFSSDSRVESRVVSIANSECRESAAAAKNDRSQWIVELETVIMPGEIWFFLLSEHVRSGLISYYIRCSQHRLLQLRHQFSNAKALEAHLSAAGLKSQ